MNERIEKLIKQATTEEHDGFRYFDKAKFAELFVRECVEQLRYTLLDTQELRQDKSTDYQVGWEDGMFDAGEMIKERFGLGGV